MRLAIKLFTIFIVIPLNARCQAVDKLSGMVLNADMSVTLKLHAPNSKDVYVKGSFLDRQFKVKTKAGSFGKAQKAKMKENIKAAENKRKKADGLKKLHSSQTID